MLAQPILLLMLPLGALGQQGAAVAAQIDENPARAAHLSAQNTGPVS